MIKEVCDICLKDIEFLKRRASTTTGHQMGIEPKHKDGNKVIIFIEFRGNPDYKETKQGANNSGYDPSAICRDCLLEGIDIGLNQTPIKIDEVNDDNFLKELKELIRMNPERESPAGKRLLYLARLIEKYEKEKFPLGRE